MVKKQTAFIGFLILFLFSSHVFPYSFEQEKKADENKKKITVILTVAGIIQTDDPWTKGPVPVNQYAKPMYRIYLDDNGNPEDGPHGNGLGVFQTHLWLDTGRVGFHWFGPDGKPGTNDDVRYWPVEKVEDNYWSKQGLEASIINNGKSLKISVPLSNIGNPKSLEIHCMASSNTSGPLDILDIKGDSRKAWLRISDATKLGTYSRDLAVGNVYWSRLSPNRKDNFDMVKVQVNIEKVKLAEPAVNISLDVMPKTLKVAKGGQAKFDIQIQNLQPKPDTFELSTHKLPHKFRSFSQERLKLISGEEAHITLSLNTNIAQSKEFYVLLRSINLYKVLSEPIKIEILPGPVIKELSLPDNTVLSSNEVIITWKTSVESTSELFLKAEAEKQFKQYTEEKGTHHSVKIENLKRNKRYDYYVKSQSEYNTSESKVRSFTVDTGIVFSKRNYSFSVERDYQQIRQMQMINKDSKPHQLKVTVHNPYDDLIMGMVGDGSMDKIIWLEPGERTLVSLAIHAQDAEKKNYRCSLRLESVGKDKTISDGASLAIRVRHPKVEFKLKEISTHPFTLEKTFKIVNSGDPVTDLKIELGGELRDRAIVQPAIDHLKLGRGKSTEFKVIPILSEAFHSEITVKAVGAGVSEELKTEVGCKEGSQLYEVTLPIKEEGDKKPTLFFKMKNWYCTNRPNISMSFKIPGEFKKANVSKAFVSTKFIPQSKAKEHDLTISMNGKDNVVKKFEKELPAGNYTFELDPEFFKLPEPGRTATNTIHLQSKHMNSGHYVVSSEMEVYLMIDSFTTYVCAKDKEEAKKAVWEKDYITKGVLDLFIDSVNCDDSQCIAYVKNFGFEEAKDVKVRFCDEFYDCGRTNSIGSVIGEKKITLPAGGEQYITINKGIPKSSPVYKNKIYVVVDPGKEIKEINEENNQYLTRCEFGFDRDLENTIINSLKKGDVKIQIAVTGFTYTKGGTIHRDDQTLEAFKVSSCKGIINVKQYAILKGIDSIEVTVRAYYKGLPQLSGVSKRKLVLDMRKYNRLTSDRSYLDKKIELDFSQTGDGEYTFPAQTLPIKFGHCFPFIGDYPAAVGPELTFVRASLVEVIGKPDPEDSTKTIYDNNLIESKAVPLYAKEKNDPSVWEEVKDKYKKAMDRNCDVFVECVLGWIPVIPEAMWCSLEGIDDEGTIKYKSKEDIGKCFLGEIIEEAIPMAVGFMVAGPIGLLAGELMNLVACIFQIYGYDISDYFADGAVWLAEGGYTITKKVGGWVVEKVPDKSDLSGAYDSAKNKANSGLTALKNGTVKGGKAVVDTGKKGWKKGGESKDQFMSYMPDWPKDMDLHFYTCDGKHIGMNYDAGVYEVQIPEALSSGDVDGIGEFIIIPGNVDGYFKVDTRGAEQLQEKINLYFSEADVKFKDSDGDGKLSVGELKFDFHNFITLEKRVDRNDTYILTKPTYLRIVDGTKARVGELQLKYTDTSPPRIEKVKVDSSQIQTNDVIGIAADIIDDYDKEPFVWTSLKSAKQEYETSSNIGMPYFSIDTSKYEKDEYVLNVHAMDISGNVSVKEAGKIVIGEKKIIEEKAKTVTVSLQVIGKIQTDDPWRRGEMRLNQWAKPMYRIGIDTNGNPKDGAWGNGQGTSQAEIWLDTGNLGFRWNGPDGKPGTELDVRYFPIAKIDEKTWSEHGIEARISGDGKTLECTFPLNLIGNPESMEVSFMCSPWTTRASDNLGEGAYDRRAWIVVPDTSEPGEYKQTDILADNEWPDLKPNRSGNFDLLRAKVVIKKEGVP